MPSISKKLKSYCSGLSDYQMIFLAFCIVQAAIFLIFGRSLVYGYGDDLNYVHFSHLLRNPGRWAFDSYGNGARMPLYFLSIYFSIPVLINYFTNLPLEWLYWLEKIIRPPLFLYLLLLVMKSASNKDQDQPNYYFLPLLLTGIYGFKLFNINLSSYQILMYYNYISTNYYLIFLAGLLMIYRRRWKLFAAFLFINPLFHPSLGALGNLFLLAIALNHSPGKSKIILCASSAFSGILLAKVIIAFTVGGHELMPESMQWMTTTRMHGHLAFPLYFPILFRRYTLFVIVFGCISFFLSRSDKLKKDLLFSFVLLIFFVISYFIIVYDFNNLTALKLGGMRTSTFVLLIALVNLGTARIGHIRDTLFLLLLVIFVDEFIYRELFRIMGPKLLVKNHYSYLLLVFLYLVCLLNRKKLSHFLKLKNGIIIFFIIPFLAWPVLFSARLHKENKTYLHMVDYITENVPKGSVFLIWGSNIQKPFRTVTQCQLIMPNYIGAAAAQTGSKYMLEDDLKKWECVLGTNVGAENIYGDYHLLHRKKVRESMSLPITSEQIKRFQNHFHVEYIIYPLKLESSLEVIYTNNRFKILKVD